MRKKGNQSASDMAEGRKLGKRLVGRGEAALVQPMEVLVLWGEGSKKRQESTPKRKQGSHRKKGWYWGGDVLSLLLGRGGFRESVSVDRKNHLNDR